MKGPPESSPPAEGPESREDRPPAAELRTPCFDVAQHALSEVERAGSRARLAHSPALASTTSWLPLRSRAWHAPPQLMRTPRITQTEVDAHLRRARLPARGDVGVLRRQLAPGPHSSQAFAGAGHRAGHPCGAAGRARRNRGPQTPRGDLRPRDPCCWHDPWR